MDADKPRLGGAGLGNACQGRAWLGGAGRGWAWKTKLWALWRHYLGMRAAGNGVLEAIWMVFHPPPYILTITSSISDEDIDAFVSELRKATEGLS